MLAKTDRQRDYYIISPKTLITESIKQPQMYNLLCCNWISSHHKKSGCKQWIPGTTSFLQKNTASVNHMYMSTQQCSIPVL